MGYIRHNAIIVTTWDEDRVAVAHSQALTIFGELQVSGIVPPLGNAALNGYRTFLIAPDGSKEGWDESDAGNARRDSFKAWLRSHCFEDGSSPFKWADVGYHDDAGSVRIDESSCQDWEKINEKQ